MSIDQVRMPLWDALQSHVQRDPLPLHVPGHKMGRGYHPQLALWWGQALRLDLTELAGLDDLHQPEGPIEEAQILAAEAFGADETFFLVNGSTVGNQAMIMLACNPGDTVIIPRNAHKSLYHALALAGAQPVYVLPEIDEKSGTALHVDPQSIQATLDRYPQAKAVVITSPTYQGICSDLQTIAGIVHSRNCLLLVDEAHGAHFGFHPALPTTALAARADMVVQSTHKMLGSLTGTAMLHVKGDRVDRHRLRQILSMLQTSSPSYLFMLSLDAARHAIVQHGTAIIEKSLQALAEGQERLARLSAYNMWVLQVDQGVSVSKGNAVRQDPFKWWINVTGAGYSGYDFDRVLQERFGIFIEMADPSHILVVFSYADGQEQVSRFLDGLEKLASEQRKPYVKEQNQFQLEIPPAIYTLGEAMRKPAQLIDLEKAAGRVAAEAVIPYPPGIPLVVPGEQLTSDCIERICLLLEQGARFQGVQDSSVIQIRVLEI